MSATPSRPEKLQSNFLRRNPGFDLVTLDLKMPGMNGIDTRVEIKKSNSDIEVIIITGVETLDTLSKALHAGALDPLLVKIFLRALQRGGRRSAEQALWSCDRPEGRGACGRLTIHSV